MKETMSEQDKKQAVKGMFDNIAHRYDFLNHFLSFNIDHLWRRKLVRELAAEPVKKVLDLATGTGDQAIAIAKRLDVSIQGLDISEGMLEIGREKVKNLKLENQICMGLGDAEAIHFPDASFDAVSISFGVRNFASLKKGLDEIFRVLRPGCRVLILEFSHPRNPLLQFFYRIYSKTYLPWMGKRISGSGGAYTYLPSTIAAFPDAETFLGHLAESGFIESRQRRLSGGIVTLYIGRKPRD
jgi:demethylmenaquinone methyltransferase / 2-methoxy-6-polyprenyl-1,4-benzoquinol methylase